MPRSPGSGSLSSQSSTDSGTAAGTNPSCPVPGPGYSAPLADSSLMAFSIPSMRGLSLSLLSLERQVFQSRLQHRDIEVPVAVFSSNSSLSGFRSTQGR